MMETNYIGAFVLSNLLLPLLKNSPVPSRIVNVTSFTHRCVSDMEVDDDTLLSLCSSTSGKYPFARIYEHSKLCMLLFSYELHRQIYVMEPSPNVSVTSADPGAVETSIMREIPSCLSQLAFTVLRILGLLQSPKSGVSAIIDAALAPPDASGEYFFGGKGRTIRSSSLSYNPMLAKTLWSSSSMLLRRSTSIAGHELMKA